MTVDLRQFSGEQRSFVPDQNRRHELGQFFTPESVADFMASLFESTWQDWNILDAGAGNGALSAALVHRLCDLLHRPKSISITAYELDASVLHQLHATMEECESECNRLGIRFSAKVINQDFIEATAPMVRRDLFASDQPQFNAAIVNPPYRKIRSDSPTRAYAQTRR